MLDEKLKELLAFAKTTDLQEVSWEKNGMKVSFRRSEHKIVPSKATVAHLQASAIEEPAEPEVMYIRSKMVGTFMRGDSSQRPPFVVEGTIVKSGEPVGAIEAMKIRKDVVSPMSCRIVKALVDDGHAVEYGQPLFEVEPENAN